MNRVLTEINIPVAQKVFEVFLPLHLTGFELLPLMVRIAIDLTDGIFMANEGTTICRKEDGSILDLNMPLCKLGLRNGDKLILF